MEEAEKLVKEEVRKIIQAVSLAIYCFAKTEGTDLTQKTAQLEYARSFQERWKKKYVGGENHYAIEEHSHCQNEILRVLQEMIPEKQKISSASLYQDVQYKIEQEEDWFEDWFGKDSRNDSKTSLKPAEPNMDTPKMSLKILRRKAINNIRFIENVVTLVDEIERKCPILPTLLHKVLYDEAEHLSQPVIVKSSDPTKEIQLSEDSGFISSEPLSEVGSDSIKNKSATDIIDELRSMEPQSTIFQSLQSIVDYIKAEIDLNTKEVVENWKESLVEYSCTIVGMFSERGEQYEKLAKDLIVDLLQDIWRDNQMNQHMKWSQQVCIVSKLITTFAICQEVLYIVTDIVDDVRVDIKKGCCSSHMIVKVALFLDLYTVTARTLNVLLKPDSRKQHHEKTNVTKLWQERLGTVVSEDCHQDIIKGIISDVIPKVVAFLIVAMSKEPVVSFAAKEALEELENLRNETQLSQESFIN